MGVPPAGFRVPRAGLFVPSGTTRQCLTSIDGPVFVWLVPFNLAVAVVSFVFLPTLAVAVALFVFFPTLAIAEVRFPPN